MAGLIVLGVLVLILLVLVLPSIRIIGSTEVGLVQKRFSTSKLLGDNPIAFKGEAGYQAELLMPGWRWRLWIVYSVSVHPWVQVPAGEIGVVISQVGKPLPIGAKSGIYKKEFGDFRELGTFLDSGGQKGVQRPVLPPGTLVPIHPVGFLVITRNRVYGVPISPSLARAAEKGELRPDNFGLARNDLNVVVIEPTTNEQNRKVLDVVGIVTTFEGEPLPSGDIASRLGGFADIEDMEATEDTSNSDLMEAIVGSKNVLHNNYQDFQAFLDQGGKIGLQHDPLLYGAYLHNPFLVKVETVPMLVVEQGEVAVIKAYVGLVSEDTSGDEFKYGTLVKPGHRGIWEEALRTGKYPINPHCYQSEIVQTAILTLNWAKEVSEAHKLDSRLSPIEAKSREGFVFVLDLQVLIHVSDVKAPKVISMVGTMQNLVDEVLQSAVGNHFRDKMQSLRAVEFIQTRQQVQEAAFSYIQTKLVDYTVETIGVYIQDVILPAQLVTVLTEREIANQEIDTYKKQEEAQQERIKVENATGIANEQKNLARSKVGMAVKSNDATARKSEAEGEAEYISQTGKAKAAEVLAVGLAKAEGYREQVKALGQQPTALVNVVGALAEKNLKFVPEVQVGGSGSALDALAGVLTKKVLRSGEESEIPSEKEKSKESETMEVDPVVIPKIEEEEI